MSKSVESFLRAQKSIPGGVNSPVRAFQSVGGTPIFFTKGKGAYLYDIDGKEYIDYMASWGPLILGHSNPHVVEEIQLALENGLSFGAPTERETILAEKILESMPAIEKIRMVNSGTEATMTAIRLSRAHTNRAKIIKFEGCYHGHSDGLLVKAGSGALTLGSPSSPGVPTEIASLTLNLPFNDITSLHNAFAEFGEDIACVIVEPVAGNMGCVLPTLEFLRALRQSCTNYGAVLIFDEVITGFRVSLSGAQGYYEIIPDLTTLGKIIGGGMPVGAVGGKNAIMCNLAPEGKVYQAGTLSGNPVAMTAGFATLTQCSQPNFYSYLETQTQKIVSGFQEMAQKHSIPLVVNSVPGMFGLFFTEQGSVNSFENAVNCDIELFKQFYQQALKEGLYFGPSAFESAFVSVCHNDTILELTFQKIDKIFAKLKV
ncbi:MAG TPA: glutamate-1-semialdehyde 2,1-aminomutase [Gammaproteobacteria bacterium]|nr:glutamate-1-semialdehyde 2,1-aminomutase [Gammaproteobacteria bacterium]